MLLANGVEQLKHAPEGWQNVPHAFKHARTRKARLPSAPLWSQVASPSAPTYTGTQVPLKARGKEDIAW